MDPATEAIGAIQILIRILIYTAMLILFFKQKNNEKRIKFVAVVAIILTLILALRFGEVMTNALILAALLLFGIPLWISRETALVLLLALAVLPLEQYFWLHLIAIAIYAIMVGGMIYAAFTPQKEGKN